MGNGPGRRRSNGELIRDRRRISDLYLQGWTQVDIAEETGLSQSTVSRDIIALQKEWQEAALIDFNEAKARELAKIDNLERIYHQAWIRSCEDAETTKTKGEPVAGTKTVKADTVERTLKGQAGDPRFLKGVEWCIERRCKILGIDAPDRHEHTGADGGAIMLQYGGNVNPDDV